MRHRGAFVFRPDSLLSCLSMEHWTVLAQSHPEPKVSLECGRCGSVTRILREWIERNAEAIVDCYYCRHPQRIPARAHEEGFTNEPGVEVEERG